VVWNGFRSATVSLRTGVRQGGILSPYLFAVFVDDLFMLLESSGKGCYVNGFCINSLMYADDLIILAITLYDLRQLLKLCNTFFTILDMPTNINKSMCSRFGLRYKVICLDIVLDLGTLKWTSTFKYLGVSVLSGKHFSCDYSGARRKFFGFFNQLLPNAFKKTYAYRSNNF